jgi:thiamine-monophosphate kinase
MKPPAGDHLALGVGGEFDAIRGFIERWGAAASGIGDDASVIDPPRGDRIVVSVDSFVAGVHFDPDWVTPAELGYRATAAALSDIAAMAAWPLGVLSAVSVPPNWTARLGEIVDGIGQAARDAKVPIVGGNLTAASELSITTTVLGHAFAPLRRSGAVPGNLVYVTGRLGGPAMAIESWRAGSSPQPAARGRFAHPIPRLHEARWLADRGATACIDISVGVFADAGHIAAASGVGIEIDIGSLPIVDGAVPAAAAASGEEYELLVTASSLDAAAFGSAFQLELTEIGRVVAGKPGVATLDNGRRVAGIGGHDHLSG